jgi:acyl-CoA reductase-like NAD-dependent aldehyde dehydrogenase
VARVTALSRRVAYGDPLDARTQVGAIVTPAHQARIDAHVKAALAAGATATLGGAPLAVPGLAGQFYEPTIVTGVTAGMALAQDEVFGPVLSVLTFRTQEEALALTNDSAYGLSAGVWSDNIHTCLAFARAAEAGTIWTNTWMDGFPEVTFGGMKQSGLGREIGPYGFDEFLEVKSLVMRIGRTRAPWVKPA